MVFSKNEIIKSSYIASLLIVTFVFLNIFITALLFIVHISVSPLQLCIASIVTVCFGLYLLQSEERAVKIAVAVAVLFSIFGSLYVTSITSDDTIDAHGYHETAVGAMRFGWNPVYVHIGDFNKSGKSPIQLQDTYYEKWDDHYPKAHWIFAANVYAVTGKIETGRSMVLLTVFALFFIALHYGLLRFNTDVAVLLAIVMALNPISTMQIFSYYNDGLMGNLLLALVLILTMLFDKKYKYFGLTHYLYLSAVLVLIVNLKFTGLLYAGVICVVYLTFAFFQNNNRRYIRSLLGVGAAVIMFGLFIIGLSSYPKNMLEKGNPLYPLVGGSSTNIITENEPNSFHGMKNLKKFFISNFSETDNISAQSGRDPSLKIPFTFSLGELKYLNYVDPRIAGYGVWFGGILIISIIWLIYLASIYLYKRNWQSLWLLLVPLIPIAIIVLVMSEAWWARYLPQLFLVPAVALVSMLLLRQKILANILMFALLFNSILILSLQISGQKELAVYNASEARAVNRLLENGKYIPRLYLGRFNGLAYRYYEKYGKVIILSSEPTGETAKNSLKLAKNIVVSR